MIWKKNERRIYSISAGAVFTLYFLRVNAYTVNADNILAQSARKI